MKKKKKLQNQQITLNQDTLIRHYSNFLTFSFLNGFRLKYYYLFIKYVAYFFKFSTILAFNFKINLFLIRLMSKATFNINFLVNYESLLLQKFFNSKNYYVDNFSSIAIRGKYRNNVEFFNRFCVINNCNINNIPQVDISNSYVISNNFVVHQLNVTYDIIYLSQLKNFIYFINCINILNFYRLIIYFNLYTIHKL